MSWAESDVSLENKVGLCFRICVKAPLPLPDEVVNMS